MGVVPILRARELAQERDLDLVEVAPQATPPVCRMMDYGRYKFEQLKREKESKRDHTVVHVKEMKLRPKISEHDFNTKYGYVRHFLADGDKVKLTITFRGRELAHQEYGRRLLDRMAEDLKDLSMVERSPLVEGKNMIMILSPTTKKPMKEPSEHSRESNYLDDVMKIPAEALQDPEPVEVAAPAAPVAQTATATATTTEE